MNNTMKSIATASVLATAFAASTAQASPTTLQTMTSAPETVFCGMPDSSGAIVTGADYSSATGTINVDYNNTFTNHGIATGDIIDNTAAVCDEINLGNGFSYFWNGAAETTVRMTNANAQIEGRSAGVILADMPGTAADYTVTQQGNFDVLTDGDTTYTVKDVNQINFEYGDVAILVGGELVETVAPLWRDTDLGPAWIGNADPQTFDCGGSNPKVIDYSDSLQGVNVDLKNFFTRYGDAQGDKYTNGCDGVVGSDHANTYVWGTNGDDTVLAKPDVRTIFDGRQGGGDTIQWSYAFDEITPQDFGIANVFTAIVHNDDPGQAQSLRSRTRRVETAVDVNGATAVITPGAYTY